MDVGRVPSAECLSVARSSVGYSKLLPLTQTHAFPDRGGAFIYRPMACFTSLTCLGFFFFLSLCFFIFFFAVNRSTVFRNVCFVLFVFVKKKKEVQKNVLFFTEDTFPWTSCRDLNVGLQPQGGGRRLEHGSRWERHAGLLLGRCVRTRWVTVQTSARVTVNSTPIGTGTVRLKNNNNNNHIRYVVWFQMLLIFLGLVCSANSNTEKTEN